MRGKQLASIAVCLLTLFAASRPAPAVAAELQSFLPPPLPWHGGSEALIAKATDPWITPAEKTGLVDTPNYDETISYLKRLADASPIVSLQEFGRTSQGRALYLVIASKDKAFTSAARRKSGKPALLAQAGIHSGEIDGKDAGLMLLRDLAFGGKAKLLDRVQFLFVPVFNADGHERSSEWNRPNQRGPIHQGWRTTAQNLNLNRDYMKADSPEMRAMLTLLNEWSPALYLDLHVTDGIDYQYDITFGYNGDANLPGWSPKIADWLHQTYRPAVEAALKIAGHVPGPLIFPRDERDLNKGLEFGRAMPRFSHGYGDLRHIPSVLVENHSLKSYRQRVLGTYVLLESTLKTLAAHGAALQKAIAADESSRPSSIPMNWSENAGRTNIDFLGVTYESYQSQASGETELRWTGVPKLYPRLPVSLDHPRSSLTRPKAYWVPSTQSNVIDRLRIHGARLEKIAAPKNVSVEMYRLVNPYAAAVPFEGRHPLKTGLKPERRTETFPAGSVRVSTDQPLGELVMALLEPESDDSLLAWGFFPEILQRTEYIEGYVIAPMAEQMLATNAQLKASFESKLAADPQFATNRQARLEWFYERSPFYDARYLLYPVGVER